MSLTSHYLRKIFTILSGNTDCYYKLQAFLSMLLYNNYYSFLITKSHVVTGFKLTNKIIYIIKYFPPQFR